MFNNSAGGNSRRFLYMERIFSHGKLLISSEYLVLDGALALALPTKLGQEFFFEEKSDNQSIIEWESLCRGEKWFKSKIDYNKWEVLETDDAQSAEFILEILKEIQRVSKVKLQNSETYSLKTNLEFPRNFGLGSSSTLMNNLALWAEIDPFRLNEKMLGGSGYDIAVAKEASALLYRKGLDNREIEKVHYSPMFKDELLFVHLNQKQNSREGIRLYQSKNKSEELIKEFSDLTEKIFRCQDLEDFSELMNFHEEKLSDFLGLETVKKTCFPDCPVFVKSLGAWGGDFVMTKKFQGYEDFFHGHGFRTFFEWNEIIK